MIGALILISQVWAQGLGEFPSYNLQWLRPSLMVTPFMAK